MHYMKPSHHKYNVLVLVLHGRNRHLLKPSYILASIPCMALLQNMETGKKFFVSYLILRELDFFN